MRSSSRANEDSASIDECADGVVNIRPRPARDKLRWNGCDARVDGCGGGGIGCGCDGTVLYGNEGLGRRPTGADGPDRGDVNNPDASNASLACAMVRGVSVCMDVGGRGLPVCSSL